MAERSSSSDEQSRISSGDPVVVLVAGKIGSGKSAALNNLFGLNFEARSSPTLVTQDVQEKTVHRNERFFSVVDTPGLGGRRITTETVVEKMVGAVKESDFVLVYCLPVKPSDTLTETDRAIVRTIRAWFGRHVWSKCVLLLTFSDIARRELETDHEYISYLQGHIEAFHRVLTTSGAKLSEIKLVFEDTRTQLKDYSSGKVVAIPVMNAEDSIGVAISPGINASWTKLALDEIIKASQVTRVVTRPDDGYCGAVRRWSRSAYQVVTNPGPHLKGMAIARPDDGCCGAVKRWSKSAYVVTNPGPHLKGMAVAVRRCCKNPRQVAVGTVLGVGMGCLWCVCGWIWLILGSFFGAVIAAVVALLSFISRKNK